mmetsp:Transcript_18434/g.33209  ORF Transcript_18434/g.33209 Transcript_18434/m.33209 type:complete len:193 (+) Transcript_18434:2049-2627(+)
MADQHERLKVPRLRVSAKVAVLSYPSSTRSESKVSLVYSPSSSEVTSAGSPRRYEHSSCFTQTTAVSPGSTLFGFYKQSPPPASLKLRSISREHKLWLDKELAASALERKACRQEVAEANSDIHRVIAINSFKQKAKSEKNLHQLKQMQALLTDINSPRKQIRFKGLRERLKLNYFTLKGRGLPINYRLPPC